MESSLVVLQSSGNKPPLFLIHPVGGTLFWYLSLIKLGAFDRPIYGIQDPGLFKTENEIPFKSIEENGQCLSKTDM